MAAAAGSAYAAIASINEFAEFAERVVRYWKAIRRKRQTLPVLSLGAIKALCIADLVQRTDDPSEILLQWAGDVGGGEQSDLSHTGEDLFLVLFGRYSRGHGETWVYLVDAYGRIVHFGEATQHPSTWIRMGGVAARPVELPLLTEGVAETLEANSSEE